MGTEENPAGNPTPDNGNGTTPEGDTTASATGVSTTAAPPTAPVKDQPNYEEKFRELQRAYTLETQRRAALEKQWGGVSSKLEEQAKILAELRKQPYDREKFLTEFQDKGPEVLRPIWSEDIEAVKSDYSKRLEDQSNEVRTLRTEVALEKRRHDTEGYPDFKTLEPMISQMIDDPNCPVDFTKPIGEVIDILYSLARKDSSADAVRLAEKAGARSAETRLVKESKTAVTGGGKAASITQPDIDKMSTEELRKYFVSVNGVVDRD